MLSINIYECILRNYIDLEEYVSNYTKGEAIDEYRYMHECPFCHANSFFVEHHEENMANSKYWYYCYGCFIEDDVIDFNARIKNISQYESMMELFNDLKKRNNAENLSDYDFVLNIVNSSKFLHDNLVAYLEKYDINEKHKNEDNYIEYLLTNAYYKDVGLELFNNPEYIYGLWEKEGEEDPELADDSFLKYVLPKLRNNKEFWIKMCKEDTNVFRYVSDALKNDSTFILECINENSHQEGLYQYIGDKLKNDKEFIIKMLQKNKYLFTRIDEKYRDDKDVVLSVFEDKKSNNKIDTSKPIKINISVVFAEPLLRYVSERLRNDKDVIMSAINYSWWEFESVPKEYKKDKEIIGKVLEKDVRAFQYVDITVKEDDEYIEELLKQYSIPLKYTNKRIQEKYGKGQ